MMAKTPRTLRAQHSGRSAAYTLVDLSGLHKETRDDIIRDAREGGGIYGVRVVEESVNGGARAPIFGVYNDGPDAERWVDAKKKLGISGEEIDDAQVYAGAGVEVLDPRKEAAIREAAAQKAEREADAIRSAENRDVRQITGEDEDDDEADTQPLTAARLDHPANLIDPDAIDAENEVSRAENQTPKTQEYVGTQKASKTKTPK